MGVHVFDLNLLNVNYWCGGNKSIPQSKKKQKLNGVDVSDLFKQAFISANNINK